VLFPPLYYSSYALAISSAAQVPFPAVVVTGVKLRLTSDIVGSAVSSAASGQPLGYQMAVAFDGKLLGPAFGKSITRALQEGCGSPAMTAISNELAARLGAAGALSAAFSALPQQVLAAAGYTPAYLAGQQLFTDSTAPSGGRADPACPTPTRNCNACPADKKRRRRRRRRRKGNRSKHLRQRRRRRNVKRKLLRRQPLRQD
jgi:hypothetical protein